MMVKEIHAIRVCCNPNPDSLWTEAPSSLEDDSMTSVCCRCENKETLTN